jgi:hypothetical protein
MRYFVMESTENISLPPAPKNDSAEIVIVSEVGKYIDVDYDYRSELISERLKLLMGMHMPGYDFKPVVYLDQPKEEKLVFWRFRPAPYSEYEAEYRNDGVISRLVLLGRNAPIVFTVKSPKGVRSVVARLAVAESALRRGILGIKFVKITDDI